MKESKAKIECVRPQTTKFRVFLLFYRLKDGRELDTQFSAVLVKFQLVLFSFCQSINSFFIHCLFLLISLIRRPREDARQSPCDLPPIVYFRLTRMLSRFAYTLILKPNDSISQNYIQKILIRNNIFNPKSSSLVQFLASCTSYPQVTLTLL